MLYISVSVTIMPKIREFLMLITLIIVRVVMSIHIVIEHFKSAMKPL